MTNQEIIDEARGIIQETDPDNTHVTDTLMLTWIDACTLQLFSLLNTLPKSSVTGITADDTVTLPEQLLKLDYVSIVDANDKHYPIKTTDFNNFIRLNPGWEDQEDGRPTVMVRMTDAIWMMFPNPDTDWDGKTLTLYGTVNPVTVATAISSPQISIVMHPCYPHFIAWKSFLVLNDPQRALTEYHIFNDMRKQNTRTATSTTGSQQQFTMPA